jgi:O-antigen/teichoic acid export membrane protein
LAVFASVGVTPTDFFAYQLIVALIEVGGLVIVTYRLVRRAVAPHEKFSLNPLLGNLTFSLTIAFVATAWVVISQTDKLILSKLLSLADYGVFSIGVVAAAAINSVGGSFAQALLPRLTKLIAENDETTAVRLYGRSTQAVCLLVAPAATVLGLFAQPVLFAWTGNPSVAHHAAPILAFYAIGNSWVALSMFAYFIQYAKGDLRLHFIGQAGLFIILVPLFLWSARLAGGVGTGLVWATVNGLYFLFWVPVIHNRVLKGEHWHWLTRDIAPILATSAAVGLLIRFLLPQPSGRISQLIFVAFASSLSLAAAIAASSEARLWLSARTRLVALRHENQAPDKPC